MSDPFALAGAPVSLHDNSTIPDLHRQRLALDERLCAWRKDYDELRRQAAATGGKCPCGGVQGSKGILLTEEAIDEDIDSRRREWTSPQLAEQLERERLLLKAELAEYHAARDAFFERTGLVEAGRRGDEIEDQIGAVTRAIWAQPLRTMADFAAALDVVLAYDLKDWLWHEGIFSASRSLPFDLWEKTPHLTRLILAVRQALPDFEFCLIREVWHDYDAVLDAIVAASADDCSGAEATEG